MGKTKIMVLLLGLMTLVAIIALPAFTENQAKVPEPITPTIIKGWETGSNEIPETAYPELELLGEKLNNCPDCLLLFRGMTSLQNFAVRCYVSENLLFFSLKEEELKGPVKMYKAEQCNLLLGKSRSKAFMTYLIEKEKVNPTQLQEINAVGPVSLSGSHELNRGIAYIIIKPN